MPAMAEETEAPPAKSSNKMLIVLLMVFFMFNIVVLGFVFLKLQKMGKPAPPAVAGAPTAGATPAASGEGEGHAAEAHIEQESSAVPKTATLDPFIINLNEPGSSRYLKLTFEVEVARASVVEDLTTYKSPVRDEVLRYLSSLTVADTLGEENKARIQSELLSRINKQLGAGRVKKLFFTDFVVQ